MLSKLYLYLIYYISLTLLYQCFMPYLYITYFISSSLFPLFSHLSVICTIRLVSSLPRLSSHLVFFVSLQACELHVAGYKFSVLSSAFVVHRGFKIQGEFHARKDEENKRNRVLFRSFKEGLKTKYPSSNRRC